MGEIHGRTQRPDEGLFRGIKISWMLADSPGAVTGSPLSFVSFDAKSAGSADVSNGNRASLIPPLFSYGLRVRNPFKRGSKKTRIF